jgi:hypothetical protein
VFVTTAFLIFFAFIFVLTFGTLLKVGEKVKSGNIYFFSLFSSFKLVMYIGFLSFVVPKYLKVFAFLKDAHILIFFLSSRMQHGSQDNLTWF